VLAERHRLAGEIHGTLAQGFTSIVTLIQAATASLEPGHPAHGHLGLALGTARDNLAEARALVTALSPAGLDEGGLGDALRRATESAAAGGGLRARSEITGTRRQLPTRTEVVLLRVCQEALANVRKHAAATQVDVRLCYTGAGVEVTVTDDGKGFDKASVNGGYGLRGMSRGRSRCRPGRPRCWRWPPAGPPTPRSAATCTSARRRSRPICSGCSASSACRAGQRP
jgi:signal transduction histidine kinase